MSVYAMLNPLNAEVAAWFEVTDWLVVSSTSTSIILENDDGTFTRINGHNIVLDPVTHEPLSGTVTSLDHLYYDQQTVLEHLAGFSVPLSQVRTVYDDVFGLQDIQDGYYNPSLAQVLLSGNDIVVGSRQPPEFRNTLEVFYSGRGNDIVLAGPGNNFFIDSQGNDIYVGGRNDNVSLLFNAVDFEYSPDGLRITMAGGHQASQVKHAASGDVDTLINIDTVIGSDHGDRYEVKDSYRNLSGDKINFFEPGAGNDTILGNGHTVVQYISPAAVKVDLEAGVGGALHPADAALIGHDHLTGVDGVMGSGYADVLLGSNNERAEVFYLSRAVDGFDVIDGRGGDHDRFTFFSSAVDKTVDLQTGNVTNSGDTTLFAKLSNIEDIEGGAGNDTISLNNKSNLVFGNAGNDVINGRGGDDVLYGDFGPDPFKLPHFTPGSPGWEFPESVAGDDILIGGMGKDIMTGGGGHNTFVFETSLDSGSNSQTRDSITDFKTGEDKIDLHLIDAKPSTAAEDAFIWIGAAKFSGHAGELRFAYSNGEANTYYGQDNSHGLTVIEADLNGDRKVDFQIALVGHVDLKSADFFL